MSSKTDKKARKVLREKIQVDGKDVALRLQSLIIKFSLFKRIIIASRILRGKPFLGSGKIYR